jgi:hypothetical protein
LRRFWPFLAGAVLLSGGPAPAHGAREVTVEWKDGEAVVVEETLGAPGPETEEKAAEKDCSEQLRLLREENLRLRRELDARKRALGIQLQVTRQQRREIRRQEGVIRGLDLLRRSGK